MSVRTIEAHILIEYEGPNLDTDMLRSELMNAVDSAVFDTGVEVNNISLDFDCQDTLGHEDVAYDDV